MKPNQPINIYINGVGCISPQPTLESDSFLENPVSSEGQRLRAIEPNYREFVPPEMVRRMGRIIKMGVAASKSCLMDAGWLPSTTHEGLPEGSTRPKPGVPDAIITGTGLGCIEDTEKFLGSMIKNREEFLTPTAFIQSTHNTVSAQIALLIKCHGYNFTYVHRGFSFETAILDSLNQLASGRAGSILLGAADELTGNSFEIQRRLGFWRRIPCNNLTLFDLPPEKGTIAGEGASFFLLEAEKRTPSYGVLKDVEMLFRPGSTAETRSCINRFLERNGMNISDIDLVLLGKNGDIRYDHLYDEMIQGSFLTNSFCTFKHLCGESMTASSFGLWLAAKILRGQSIPAILHVQRLPERLTNILLYNIYQGINHSFILLTNA